MMMKIRAIIVEDEAPATELLQSYLQEFPNIELMQICSDGFSGVKAIQEHHPQLIFLDVQMPKINGFEMLELLDEQPYVIFTTAFDEYAIKAFEMNAVDYLLKPFSRARFSQAVQKAIERIHLEENAKSDVSIKEKSDFLLKGQFLERIVVKNRSKILVFPIHKISHIQAYDDYVIIFSDGDKHLKNKTMIYYETHLPPQTFVRVHRSYIVNVDYIDEIMLWEKETYLIQLKTGEKIRASRSGYKKLKEVF
jgi:two-component system, LytTR family, response regulator